MKLVTEDQFYGWVATTDNYDGPGSPLGSGSTEQEAVGDLLEILEDDESFGELVEQVRTERIAKGLNPDTGRPLQPGEKHG